MAYKPGTTLKRKAPHGDDPYDAIRVIGQNPISDSAGQQSEWEGELGTQVVVTPHETFGSNIPLPLGQLDTEYDVVEIPDEKPHARPEPQKAPEFSEDAESPERKLRREAEEAGLEESEEREETPLAASAS